MELGPERERALIVRSCGTGLVKLNELSSIFSVLKKKKKRLYGVFFPFQLKFYWKGGNVGFITSEQLTHEIKCVVNWQRTLLRC